MPNHRVHACIKVMVGFVAMSAYAEATEVNGNEENFVEIVYVDVGLGDTIDCTAADPGYAYLEDGANEEVILSENISHPPVPVMDPPGFRVYKFVEGKLPQLIDEFLFDEEELALDGHAYGTLTPFPIPPNDQIVTLNNDNGGIQVVMLENTDDPDLHISCTVFTLESDFTANAAGYYPDVTAQSVKKKKAVKRKVAHANKRKVKKKAARKKAAAKKRKAAPKRKKAG